MSISRRLLLLGLVTLCGHARAAFTGNRCWTRSTGDVASLCPGRTLPRDRLRNFERNRHMLKCTSNSDNFIRRPQRFDFLRWADLRSARQNQEAFDLRRELPPVEWQGQIPYRTIEVWSWQECSIGTDAAHCGTESVCHTETVTECDSKGEHCRTREVQVCHDEPNTCYYDQDRDESMHCSNETMDYHARYQRPGPSEWNMSSDRYAEFLPNKYDLMPGELEVVQTFTNDALSSTLSPQVEIGDAWNKYKVNLTGTAVGAACRPNTAYALDVNIVTLARNTNKATPNIFRLPVDEEGRPQDPISNWMGDARVTKGQPISVMLDDSAAAVVKALAEHSQDNADRLRAQVETGKITNADGLTNEQAAKQGFLKSTMVRIRLIKKNRYWFNRRIGWDIYNNDVHSVVTSNNSLAQDQDILLADKWEIDLLHSKTRRGRPMDIYWRDTFHLAPNRVYALEISTYQRGVPFYRQDCETDPRFACNWPLVGRREDTYYSKPMEIRFETNANWHPKRTFSNFVIDNLGPLDVLGKIFEPLVKEPTRGENHD